METLGEGTKLPLGRGGVLGSGVGRDVLRVGGQRRAHRVWGCRGRAPSKIGRSQS